MPLERIDDEDGWGFDAPCNHPDHEPPKHIVLKPGRYRHTCPRCGKTSTFTVPAIIC